MVHTIPSSRTSERCGASLCSGGEGEEAGLREPAVAAPPPTISSSAPCDLAVALARSCASATASCQEASPCSAAGAGAEGAGLSPASEKMREDLALVWCGIASQIHELARQRQGGAGGLSRCSL